MFQWIGGRFREFRRTLRSLGRRPGLAAAAVLSLALGIGANVALFSVVHGVLLRPLPYDGEERLVRLWEEHEGARTMVPSPLLSNLTLNAWRGTSSTLEGLGAYGRNRFIEKRSDANAHIEGASLSPILFSLLGARPAAGRLFVEADAVKGAAPVAVLSYGFWQDRFSGDAAALGRSLVLDGESHTIVGVASPGFFFPDREVSLWVPHFIAAASTDPTRSSLQAFSAVGKLRAGVTPARAAAEGTARARAFERPPVAQALFGAGGPVVVEVRQLRREMTDRVRPAVLILAFGVGLILLICCANVANLLLSRGVSRQRELALRAALGAGRGHLLGQVMAESLTLAAGGGVLGLALGAGLLRALPALAPADFPRLDAVHLDGRALAFGLMATLGAGLLSGLLPALRASRIFATASLGTGPGGRRGSRSFPFGRGLLIAEAALAVMLLVAAGLLLHSFSRLLRVDAGYDRDNVLAARVSMPGGSRESLPGRIEEILQAVRAADGVVAAGAGNMAPLTRNTSISQFPLSRPGPGGETITARAITYVVTPGYAEALSLRLRQGRLFSAADLASGTRPMLVNEEFVRAYLSDGEPTVGRRLDGLFRGDEVPTEIVGVVADVLRGGLDDRPQGAVYTIPRHGYSITEDFSLLVRTARAPLDLVPLFRDRLRRVAPWAVVDVATLSSQVSASVGEPRFAAATLGAFALLALVLAATGLYGVLSYSVSRRTRELGIRSALGARRGDLVSMVLRQGLGVTAVGLFFGMTGAALLTRWLEALLFGVTPLDPLAFTAAPLLLFLVAAVACWPPARRAAATEPSVALRTE